jgi:hypothetical protein
MSWTGEISALVAIAGIAFCVSISQGAESEGVLLSPGYAAPVSSPAYEVYEQETERVELILRPYLWAASMKGNATAAGVTSQVDVGFTDILKAMDYGAMGQAEFRYGNWFVIPDTLLLKISAAGSISRTHHGKLGLVDITGNAEGSVDLFTYFQELMFGYRVMERSVGDHDGSERKIAFDVLAGGRYYLLDVDIRAKAKVIVDGPNGPRSREVSGSVSTSEDWIDPVVGARVIYDVTDRLNVSLRGDIGGFGVGSDLAWGAAAIGHYKLTDRWSLDAGYKILDIDYADGPRGIDMQMTGPVLGISYKIDF